VTSRALSLVVGAIVGGIAVILTNIVVHTTTVQRADCVELVTSSSTEKGDLIEELAGRYNKADRTFDGRCATVRAYKKTSGATLELLEGEKGWVDTEENQPKPQVWMPSSSLWLTLLQHHGKGDVVADGAGTSLTTSPMVIAMPKPMAEALGWPKPLGWSDLNLNSRGGWGATGKQNEHWGRFTLGKDNPRRSTSGLAATIAAYQAATNGNYSQLDDDHSSAIQYVRGIEASVAYYSDDSVKFLKTLYEEDQKTDTPYISAMLMQEEMVYLYNHGAPTGDPKQLQDNKVDLKRPLVAITPAEGTVMIDHPYLTLASATEDQRAAAKDFYEFMLEPAQQDRFRELGFRDRSGVADQKLMDSVSISDNRVPRKISLPPADVIDKMLKSWDLTQRRGRILLVLDVSGSMKEPFVQGRFDKPYSERRIDLLKPAVARQLALLNPKDEIGLWTFSDDGPQEQVPIGKVEDVRDEIVRKVQALQPVGNTALYKTVQAANKKMRDEFKPDFINAIVLLSDGENTTPGVTKEQVLKDVDAARLDNSVRIFTIAYSAQADADVLAQIAEKSKARSYNASDPLNVDRVFVNAFSNF
jgi:Ca-activated chloride channel family protein